jgi:hypothetical protein
MLKRCCGCKSEFETKGNKRFCTTECREANKDVRIFCLNCRAGLEADAEMTKGMCKCCQSRLIALMPRMVFHCRNCRGRYTPKAYGRGVSRKFCEYDCEIAWNREGQYREVVLAVVDTCSEIREKAIDIKRPPADPHLREERLRKQRITARKREAERTAAVKILRKLEEEMGCIR